MNLNLRVGLYCLLGGPCFTIPALGDGHFWLWWLCGVLTTAALTPVVRFGPRHMWAQFGAIFFALVTVGLVCTLSEGALFFPAIRANLLLDLTGGTVSYLMTAAVLAALAKLLRVAEPSTQVVEHRSIGIAIPLVLLAGLSYVLYYQLFGMIAFEYFTRQYYPHAVEDVAKLGVWFYAYQWARGTLMTLAVLPVIYTLRLRRWHAALAVGILVWILGGGASLLVPNGMMAPLQRYEHIIEIMTQNVSLGVTALLLLRPREDKLTAIAQSTPTPAI